MRCIELGCRRHAEPGMSRCHAHLAALYRRLGL